MLPPPAARESRVGVRVRVRPQSIGQAGRSVLPPPGRVRVRVRVRVGVSHNALGSHNVLGRRCCGLGGWGAVGWKAGGGGVLRECLEAGGAARQDLRAAVEQEEVAKLTALHQQRGKLGKRQKLPLHKGKQ